MAGSTNRISGADLMKIMSYQAAIAIAVATIFSWVYASGTSFGDQKGKVKQNEERSKQNQKDIADLKGDVREILVILREREKSKKGNNGGK